MSNLKIPKNEHTLDNLPDERKSQRLSIFFAEQKLFRIQNKAAVLKNAKDTYLQTFINFLTIVGRRKAIKLS